MNKKGKKFDNDNGTFVKSMWHLLPFKEIKEVVDVLTFGANVYGEDDWKHFISRKNNENRYFSAALRHLYAWKIGNKTDDETKLSHLAHAVCCILFVMWKDNNEKRKNQ